MNPSTNTAAADAFSEFRRSEMPVSTLQLASSTTKAAAAPQKTMMDLGIDQDTENLRTYVAEGDVVMGSLKLKGGARVAGVITGDLVCEDGSAIIEESGSVEGSVSASNRIVIAGAVGHGADNVSKELVCPGDIIMLGTGKVVGSAYYGNLVTYDGGMIEGRVAPYKNYAAKRD